jgi:UDPglucose 6-dehydrogenase
MNVGIVGMGKLGLPVALAIESRGHEVIGYDVNPDVYEYMERRTIPFQEEGLQPLLDNHNVQMERNLGALVARSDIIFLPVQTPHDPRYEGTTRIPDDRKDFDYRYLESALADVSNECAKLAVKKTVAVISTCLPGTYERTLKPLTNEYVDYVYTPQFIAMGTVLDDYLNPEFNLIGVESEEAADQLEEFYSTINDAPAVRTDITTAEGIKVSYNTWITAKTVIANAWGELAERTGMNFDDIKRAWGLSNKRLISNRYMNAGMSDGGGCHPRDNIAMSWLASETGMSHNLWEDLMAAREDYEEWHANVILDAAQESELPIVILGRSFKPETNIETGSPSILVSNILNEIGALHEHVDEPDSLRKAVYFIGTQHQKYADYDFPEGSIVIDPFGYIQPQHGVDVRALGR